MMFKKYLIIGSGLSSYVFLKNLQKKKLKDCYVVTGKSDNHNIFYDINKLDVEVSSNFGGLGKNWLGGFSDYNYNELKNKIPNSLKIFNLFKNLKKKKILNLKLINTTNFPNFFQKLKKVKSKKLSFQNINLLRNFVDDKEKILRPNKIKNVNYINGQIVNIEKKNNFYISEIINNKKKILVKSKFIFFGCGTISTTKILMNMKVLKKKIRIKHQPYFYGFYFIKNTSKKKFIDIKRPILNYSYSNGNNSIQGTIGSFNKRINIIIKNKIMNMINPFLFKKIFFNNFIFFNAFMKCSKSNLYLIKRNNNFELISYSNVNNLRDMAIIIKNKIKKILLRNDIKVFLDKIIFPKFGYDKHYFGSLSLKKNDVIKNNSELKKFKNIFIIDQSVIDISTNKFVTLISLLNSIIVSKYINNNS